MNKVLSYPLNVDQADGHYLLFQIFETEGVNYPSPYTDINIPQQKMNRAKIQSYGVADNKLKKIFDALSKATGFRNNAETRYIGNMINNVAIRPDSRTFAGQGKAKKSHLKGAIALYTPQQIKVSHKMQYQQEDLSFLGANVAGFLEAMQGTGFTGKAKNTLNAFKTAGQKMIAGLGQFAGTGGLQQSIFGSAVNRNLAEVIFTGLEYRTFSFEYSFMPKSKNEAIVVDEIINMLTYYALPNRKQNSAQTFDIPAEFMLKYMYFGKQNKYIHPALTLALESIDITYGGSKFATFRGDERGAQPIKTDVTLTFRELEYADRHTLYDSKINEDVGYGQAEKNKSEYKEFEGDY
mgnify:FL=1